MKHVSAIKGRIDNERKYFINWKIRLKETKNWGRHHHQAFRGAYKKKFVPSFKNEHTYWFSFSYTSFVWRRERVWVWVGEWKYFFPMTSSSRRQSFFFNGRKNMTKNSFEMKSTSSLPSFSQSFFLFPDSASSEKAKNHHSEWSTPFRIENWIKSITNTKNWLLLCEDKALNRPRPKWLLIAGEFSCISPRIIISFHFSLLILLSIKNWAQSRRDSFSRCSAWHCNTKIE